MFCTQFDGTTYSNRHKYITQFKSSWLVEHIYIRYKRVPCIIYTYTYISFTHELQSPYSILLPALGPLLLRIHRFPLELLVRAPLVEDCPASGQSNLKKGSIYQSTNDGNKLKIVNIIDILVVVLSMVRLSHGSTGE